MRRALVLGTAVVAACARGDGTRHMPSDTASSLVASSPVTLRAEPNANPSFCVSADTGLFAILRIAPLLEPSGMPYIHSPDDGADPGPDGFCTFPRAAELRLADRYRQIPFDSGPSVFLLGRAQLGGNRTVYALRVPGMYDPDRVDLYVLDDEGQRLGEPVEAAEAWGDAGESVWVRSWLLDLNHDGYLDVIRHTCATADDIENDSTPTKVESDSLVQILWKSDRFGPPEVVRDSALARRFVSGSQSCLPSASRRRS